MGGTLDQNLEMTKNTLGSNSQLQPFAEPAGDVGPQTQSFISSKVETAGKDYTTTHLQSMMEKNTAVDISTGRKGGIHASNIESSYIGNTKDGRNGGGALHFDDSLITSGNATNQE